MYAIETAPSPCFSIFFFNDTATTEIYTLSLHDALPIYPRAPRFRSRCPECSRKGARSPRSEEHTSELQSRVDLVCRLLLERKQKTRILVYTASKETKKKQTTPMLRHN